MTAVKLTKYSHSAGYRYKISPILCDVQTSGGLPNIVKKNRLEEFETVVEAAGLPFEPICKTIGKSQHFVEAL